MSERQSLFRRLRAKLKQERSLRRKRDLRISELSYQLRDEERKSLDLKWRLERVVKATAERHSLSDTITLCVQVDRKAASQFPAIWEEATRQLGESISKEMSRNH